MNTSIKRWGNSQGLYIPKSALRELNWDINETVTLSVRNGSIIIEKADNPAEKAAAFKEIKKLRKSIRNMDADKERTEYLEEKYGL